MGHSDLMELADRSLVDELEYSQARERLDRACAALREAEAEETAAREGLTAIERRRRSNWRSFLDGFRWRF